MAGHSHWANIKRKKAAIDNKRGKLWSKLARQVIVAAKLGGGNPNENVTLRYAIDRAKAANMPNDTIDRAIAKATGEADGASFHEITYEGYGPEGVAILVEALTDNVNRTAGEVRFLFDRYGGNLGATNCVAWQFKKKGLFAIAGDAANEEQLMEIALDAGAEDVARDGDVWEIVTEPAAFGPVRDALADKKIETLSADLSMISDNTVEVSPDAAQRVLKLIDALEDNDDVQNVHSNAELPETA
jgi:YebC/PmpR family DNA-binding regulatory protein